MGICLRSRTGRIFIICFNNSDVLDVVKQNFKFRDRLLSRNLGEAYYIILRGFSRCLSTVRTLFLWIRYPVLLSLKRFDPQNLESVVKIRKIISLKMYIKRKPKCLINNNIITMIGNTFQLFPISRWQHTHIHMTCG